jgi:hypothetical protein
LTHIRPSRRRGKSPRLEASHEQRKNSVDLVMFAPTASSQIPRNRLKEQENWKMKHKRYDISPYHDLILPDTIRDGTACIMATSATFYIPQETCP